MWPFVISAAILGQAKPLPEGVRVGFAPRDAAIAAWIDLSQNVPIHDHRWQWYLWNDLHEESPEKATEAEKKKAHEAGMKSAAALNLMVNEVMSRNGRIIYPGELANPLTRHGLGPAFVAGGRLLRYDLRRIASRRPDFEKLWTALQAIGEFETTFHEPAGEPQVKWVKKQVAWYRGQKDDGSFDWYDFKWEKTVEYRGRQFALHAGGAGPLRLLSEQAGASLLPIARGSEFLPIAYSAISIDGVIGKYYELAGIELNPKGKSGFDAYLESLGVSAKIEDDVDGSQRAAMISNLAYRWRRVSAFFGKIRPEFGPSLITVTRDIVNNETTAKRNAYLNLLKFQDQAREVIAAKSNGLHQFLLTDGEGKIITEAAANAVPWRDSPHLGSAQLFSAISCKGCHGPVGGYKEFRNEVREDMRKGFVPVADLSSGKTAEEVRDAVESFYDGDLEGPIKFAANAYALATDRATWGVFGKDAVQGCTAEIMRIYSAHVGLVTPRIALREMGFIATDDKVAAKAILEMCPPSADEQGLIGRLRLGGTITRGDWREISYEVALRTMLYREPIPETKPAANLQSKP